MITIYPGNNELPGDIYPFGNDKDIQFNDGGFPGGSDFLIWDSGLTQLGINSNATPTSSQVRVTSNSLGGLSLLVYAADNVFLAFDTDWAASAFVARSTSVAALNKTGAQLLFRGSTGDVVGNAATLNTLMTLDLATGRLGIGANPGYLLDVAGDINLPFANTFKVTGQSILGNISGANGYTALFDGSGTRNGQVLVGGTGDPGTYYDNTTHHFRARAGGADIASITALAATFTQPVVLKGYTVATLPAGTVGMVVYCTNLNAPGFHTIAAGGGIIVGPVFYDGTNWICI